MTTEKHPIRRKNSCDATEPGMQCAYADQMSQNAAEHAIKKVFAILGVDIDHPESVEEFREDLRFGKKMRKVADHGLLAFFGVMAAAFAVAVWDSIVSHIKH